MSWKLFKHHYDDEEIDNEHNIDEVNKPKEKVKVNIQNNITYIPIEDKTSASESIAQNTQLELISPSAISIDEDFQDTVLVNENSNVKNLYVPFYVPVSAYPHQINTNALMQVVNLNFVDVTIDIQPIANDLARKRLEHMQTIIDSNLEFQQQQNIKLNIRENALKSNSIDILLNGINQLDNRLYNVALTFLVSGHTPSELKQNCSQFSAVMANNGFAVQKMIKQVKSGLVQNIPLGTQLGTLDYMYRNIDRQALAVLDMAQNATGSFNGGIPIAKNIFNSQHNLEYINVFSEKYNNHNFGIIGTSGTGKSTFNKEKIYREVNILNIHHQVIDLTGEYVPLAKYLRHNAQKNGHLHDYDSINLEFTTDGNFVINPLDINIAERELTDFTVTDDNQDNDIDLAIQKYIQSENFDKSQIIHRNNKSYLRYVPLEQKILQFSDFINQIYNVDGNGSHMNFEERSALMKAVRMAYEEKGITINPSSLYENRASFNHGVFQDNTRKDMPTLTDIDRILRANDEQAQTPHKIDRLLAVIEPYLRNNSIHIFDGQSFFGNGIANSSDLGKYSFVNYDISKLDGSFSHIAYYVILQNIWNNWITSPLYSSVKKIVDVDEVLQEIDNPIWAKFMELVVRQSRKYNAGITWLTQDYDRLDNNDYANALISNSNFFFFTHILPTRRDVIKNAFHLNAGIMNQLCSDTTKGDGILMKGNEKLFVHVWVRPQDFEFVESDVAKREKMHATNQTDYNLINKELEKDRYNQNNNHE